MSAAAVRCENSVGASRRAEGSGRARLRGVLAALLAAVVLVGAEARARAGEIEVHEGRRVRVFSTVPGTAKRAAEDLDAALAVYEEHLPWRMPEGERLVVRLHATQDEYAAAVKAADASPLESNQAATLWATRESHVVVQPRSEAAFLALVGGLPEYTRFLVCHEGVHQFLHRAGAAALRTWPDWYGEGMAEWLAERCLETLVGRAPRAFLLQDRDHLVRSALEEGRAPRLERLLHAKSEGVEDRRLFYACWLSLYRFLAADPTRLADLHARVRKACEGTAGAAPPDAVALAKAFATALAESRGPLGDLESRWTRSARETKPEWFEGLRSAQRLGEETLLASWPDGNAYLLRAERVPASPITISLEVNLLDLGTRQAEVVLAHERPGDPRFLKVALGSAGYATLLAFSDGNWQERYRANAPVDPALLVAARWIPVRIAAGAGRIRVEVAGTRVLDAAVPPSYSVEGNRIGIGCRGGACRFRALRVSPARGG